MGHLREVTLMTSRRSVSKEKKTLLENTPSRVKKIGLQISPSVKPAFILKIGLKYIRFSKTSIVFTFAKRIGIILESLMFPL